MVTERFPMTIGGEEVLTEHLLLHNYESGEMMDSPESVRFLAIHCSATKASRNYTAKQLIRDLPGTTPKACPCFDAAAKFNL